MDEEVVHQLQMRSVGDGMKPKFQTRNINCEKANRIDPGIEY